MSEEMKRDFERLAKERLARVVEDVLDLYEIAELSRRDALLAILAALFSTTAKVMAFAGPLPSRDDLYALIDSLLRSASRRLERIKATTR